MEKIITRIRRAKRSRGLDERKQKITRPKPSDAYQIHYQMMTITGIWPKENADKMYWIRTCISLFLCRGIFVTMCIEAVNDITDFAKLSEILYMMVTYVAFFFKWGAFVYHKKTFSEMIEFLENPIFTSHPTDLDLHLDKWIKYSKITTKILQYLTIIGILLLGSFTLFDNFSLLFPFPYDLGNYQYLMLVFQLSGEICAAWNNISLDLLFVALVSVAAAQLDILAEKIIRCKLPNHSAMEYTPEQYKIIEKDAECVTYLKQCVQHHLAIIRIIDTVETIFTFGLLAQFIASAIVICNTLFQFILIPFSLQFLGLIIYFMAIIVQLFMYCWYGHNIIWKSALIGDACYHADWHLCNSEVRKYLFIIMERSKRPLKITTMKFATLSLSSFLSILQWSYSFFTLMLNMFRKRS